MVNIGQELGVLFGAILYDILSHRSAFCQSKSNSKQVNNG
jgi:hypothetical protein